MIATSRHTDVAGVTISVRYKGPKAEVEVQAQDTHDHRPRVFRRGEVVCIVRARWVERLVKQPGFEEVTDNA